MSLFARMSLIPLIVLAFAACAGGAGDGDGGTDRSAYPDGPYGTGEGDVIAAHTFVDTEGNDLSLEDLFKNTDNKLLLLSTAAGWCAPCREEQPALQARRDTWGDDGLAVMVALFENAEYQPATPEFAAAWKAQYSLDIDVVVDADFELAAYYNEDLTPMNMFVDIDTMEILRIQTGFDESTVDAIIESQLAE